VACTPARYDFINFCFRAERLDRALRVRCQRTLAEVLPHTSAISAPVASMVRLHAAAQATFAPLTAAVDVLDLSAADQAMEERVLAELCSAPPLGRRAGRRKVVMPAGTAPWTHNARL
jgi:hypothetical protein